MKKINICALLLFINSVFTTTALAVNLQLADQAFVDKRYTIAISEYKKAAKIGNAKAFYQLSQIYHQGLGTPKNELLGIVWMAIAAEYQYDNAVENLQKMQASLHPAKRGKIEAIIADYLIRYRQDSVADKYYPRLLTANLKHKIRLSDNGENTAFELDETAWITTGDLPDLADESWDDEDDLPEDISELSTNMPYYLVVDYDIGPDGSVRDVNSVFSIGDGEFALEQLNMTPMGTPVFADKNVNFLGRTILGIVNTDTISMRREHTEFYVKTLRFAAKLKGSTRPIDNYNLALALMHFPWLRGDDNTIDLLLKNAATQGVPLAQYEYGLKIYRQQTSPKQAIYWLGEAAKQGVTKAEYRLGRVILDSPWVEKDLSKAYFWLSQAALKKDVDAMRGLAELKLTAKQTDLYDPKGAITLLDTIMSQQAENPQYRYLLALAYAKPENRQFALAVSNLRKAITIADSFHWDTQQWRSTLKSWTSGGSVTVTDL